MHNEKSHYTFGSLLLFYVARKMYKGDSSYQFRCRMYEYPYIDFTRVAVGQIDSGRAFTRRKSVNDSRTLASEGEINAAESNLMPRVLQAACDRRQRTN